MPSDWRDRNSRDRRESVAPVPTVLDWSLSPRRPGSSSHRLEHKASFVNKHEAFLAPSSLFLYAASASSSSAGPPPRRVPEPAARASDSSSPGNEGTTRHILRNMRLVRLCLRRSSSTCRHGDCNFIPEMPKHTEAQRGGGCESLPPLFSKILYHFFAYFCTILSMLASASPSGTCGRLFCVNSV